MQTKEELQALSSKQLNEKLDELAKTIGEKLPKSGTNEEKIERVLTAQEMAELDGKSSEGNEDKSNTYQVSSVSKGGFWRCGIHFAYEGAEVALTDEQLERVRAEKHLIIKE